MADIDLTQYNGSQAFPATADVGTNADPFLTPTDGKVITALSNGQEEAPVNRSIYRVKDLLLGLRGAIVGDFTGAARKTLHSLHVDGTGGQASTRAPGELYASKDIISTGGDFLSFVGSFFVNSVGRFQAGTLGSENTVLRNFKLAFQSTGSDANPPQGTLLANELRAINTPKVSAFISMSAADTIASFDGHGVDSVAIPAPKDIIVVTFKAAFDNTRYTVKTSGVVIAGSHPVLICESVPYRTTTTCTLAAYDLAVGAFVNFGTTPVSFSVSVDGRQTT